MKDYYFIGMDGALHDTRNPHWASNPLRENYRHTFGEINSLANVKATLRASEYAWPGSYPMFFITADGAALSFSTVRQEFRQVAWDWLHDASTGWRVIACQINWEDNGLYCEHSGDPISAAYE